MFHPKPARQETVLSPETWFSYLFSYILLVLSILTSAAVGNVHISFALWSWLCVRIRLGNCVCAGRWWILAIAWLGAHERRTCPSPSRFSPSFRCYHLAPAAPWGPAQLLMLCWVAKAKKTMTLVPVRSWYFPFCLCKEWRKMWKGRKLSLIFI